MKEIWKGVVWRGSDYSEFYEVSNKGRIRGVKTGNIRKLNLLKTGYCFVSISLGSRDTKFTWRVHRIVAETFIKNPGNKRFVNHKDCIKTNNYVNNLEWVTAKENTAHAIESGLISTEYLKGENNVGSKLNVSDVNFILNKYKPYSRKYGSRAISRDLNVNKSTVCSIINNKTWIHIDRSSIDNYNIVK